MTRATLALALLFLASCAAAPRERPSASVEPDEEAPIERGRLVFMAQCNKCHPGGEGGLGPSLKDKRRPRLYYEFRVRHGFGSMPAFSKERIGDDQLSDLIAYLAALRRFDDRRDTAEAR